MKCGDEHWFAASIEWGLKEKWFIPFSHTLFAKLCVKERLTKIAKKNK